MQPPRATTPARSFLLRRPAPDRDPGQAVLLTCHYNVLDWLEPDWVFDTATGAFRAGRCLWRRPKIRLAIYRTDWRHWPLFEPHRYLKLPPMIAAFNYVGAVDGELVAHVAVSTRPGLRESCACRLVVMPEWQGAGVPLYGRVCGMRRRVVGRPCRGSATPPRAGGASGSSGFGIMLHRRRNSHRVRTGGRSSGRAGIFNPLLAKKPVN